MLKEEEIINCLKRKDKKAAELFLQQYRPLIRYVVTPFLQNEQDIEECINDVALKVCDLISTYHSNKGSWKAWITAIARNTALNKKRTYKKYEQNRVSLETENMGEVPSRELTPEEMVIQKEKQQLLVNAINSLKREEQILFYRRYYYQQPIRQIGAELGMTERSVEGKLYRIRKKLIDRIGGEMYD